MTKNPWDMNEAAKAAAMRALVKRKPPYTPPLIAVDPAKPGSEKTVFHPAMPVTIFKRPNAQKKDTLVIVDEETAVAAGKLLDAIPRGRFTYENCGTFASLCLEGEITCDFGDGDEKEMADIVLIPAPLAEVQDCDWKGFVEACMADMTVRAILDEQDIA